MTILQRILGVIKFTVGFLILGFVVILALGISVDNDRIWVISIIVGASSYGLWTLLDESRIRNGADSYKVYTVCAAALAALNIVSTLLVGTEHNIFVMGMFSTILAMSIYAAGRQGRSKIE